MNIQEIRQQYPQYEDMSDEQLARALHSRYYSDMDFGEFSQRIGYQAPAPEQRSTGQELMRQGGLAARYLVEGVTALPAMAAAPLSGLANRGLEAIGSDTRLSHPSVAISNLLDRAGLPQPQGATERVVGDASRALSAGGGVAGTAQRVSNPIAQMIAAAPRAQAAGEIAGAGSAGIARENGASPLTQMLVGAGAGIAAPLAPNALGGAMRAGRAVFEPMTAGGRNAIASRVLRSHASAPTAATNRLMESLELVPGSRPTTGAASRDYGLLALEKGLRGQNAARFAERTSEQNAARQAQLDRIAGTPEDIADDIAAREAGTASAREAAFAGQPQVDTAPILARADEILASAAGARGTVRRAVTQFRNAIEGETDAARLYEIRKDIGDALGGRLAGDRADYKLASRELIDLRNSIDDQIEGVAPGFRAYLARYAELSRPINQREALQELQRRAAVAAPDINTGREFLSQARYRQALNAMMRDRDAMRSLTDEQLETARAVAADLDLGASINNSAIRAPGSDTFQNLSTANVISSATRGSVPPTARALMRPLEFLYRYTDDDINRLLVEAMMDPQLAAQMLQRATPQNIESTALTLAERARQLGIGAGVGATTTTQQPPQ